MSNNWKSDLVRAHRWMRHGGYPSVNDGWEKLVTKLVDDISEIVERDNLNEFQVAQVKEKFGTLRFYCYGGTDEIHALIEAAEEESGRICEDCGKPGRLMTGGPWIHTACPDHEGDDR